MKPASVFSPSCALPCLLAAAALAASVPGARAQAPGTMDPSFTMTPGVGTVFAVVSEEVPAIPATKKTPAVPANLRIFAGGDNGYEEISNPNGVVKGDFVQPTFGSASRLIYAAVEEPYLVSGFQVPMLLLGGLFGQSAQQITAGLPGQNIVRIYPDGTQDPTFLVNGFGANNYVTAIIPTGNSAQTSKILVGGLFTSFNEENHSRIVRLNNDGTVDESFANGINIDNEVLTLAQGISPSGGLDGTTLVAGTFNHVNGQNATKLARLDANGNLDTTFRPNIDQRVLAIHVQATGKIIIGGQFTLINGQPVQHIARLNYDGSLDTTFGATVSGEPTGEPDPVAVYVITPISDGRMYVGGNFTTMNGVTRRYLGVLNPDGSLGALFDPGTAIYDKVQSVFIQPLDGKVLVGQTLGPKIGSNNQVSLIRLFGASKKP